MKKLRDMTEPELRDLLNAMAAKIMATSGNLGVEKPHFALLVFNDPEIAQYICNCERTDVVKAMRECADRLEGRQDLEREPFGPTGDYPRGSMSDDDEGEIRIGIAAVPISQTVVMNFGKKIAWVGFSPKDARQMAKSLIANADKLDGGIGA